MLILILIHEGSKLKIEREGKELEVIINSFDFNDGIKIIVRLPNGKLESLVEGKDKFEVI